MANELIVEAQQALAELKKEPVLHAWQERHHQVLDELLKSLPKSSLEVMDFQPRMGRPGSVVEIFGAGFGDRSTPTVVVVGGEKATVLEKTPVWLRVLSGPATDRGKVEIDVGGNIAVAPFEFEIAPDVQYADDGPPLVLTGEGGQPLPGLPKAGPVKVFVALVAPSDFATVPAATRTTVVDNWTSVSKYYQQASFTKLNVSATISTSWTKLTGKLVDYYWDWELDSKGNQVLGSDGQPVAYNNFWSIQRLAAEAVDAYQADIVAGGFDMVVVCCYLGGKFARAMGNLEAQTFAWPDLKIHAALGKSTAYVLAGESADWGRLAHETGHNLVDPKFARGAVLGEDVYGSDLIDPGEATAAAFDLMGEHDSHPLFSAFHLENLGWLTDNNAAKPNEENVLIKERTNILRVRWDRNPRSLDVDLVAHGLSENSSLGRYHVLKIIVTPSLAYYVEVRQTPGTTTQVFDPNIPIGTAPNGGGTIVTRVLTDTVNNNNQTRFVTLAHPTGVLTKGQSAVDPLRSLSITVLEDSVQAHPLVCRVRVAWAQTIADDPAGKFDLRIDPWNSSYESPDIWVDRAPFGKFTNPMDAEGRPTGSGDRPLVGAKNALVGRIHNDGTDSVADVQVTFYTVTPPGVGDNGAWTPLKTMPVAAIPAGGYFDVPTNWVPLAGQHTCVKVAISRQLGEVTGGNNLAQENILYFDLPSSSPIEPVSFPVAIRNPSPRRERIHLVPHISGRWTDGYVVAVPHQWVWVDGSGERIVNIIVAAPGDLDQYLQSPAVDVRISGYLERRYTELDETSVEPGEYLTLIGGLTARCKAKLRATIQLVVEETDETLFAWGSVAPGSSGLSVLLFATGLDDGDLAIGSAETASDGAFGMQLRKEDVVAGRPEITGRSVGLLAVLVDAPTLTAARSNPQRGQF